MEFRDLASEMQANMDGLRRLPKSKKDRQHNGQKEKDRQHNGQKEKDRQHNGQKEKDERTNNDIRNITHKTKNRVTLTPLKTGDKHSCPGRAGIPLT